MEERRIQRSGLTEGQRKGKRYVFQDHHWFGGGVGRILCLRPFPGDHLDHWFFHGGCCSVGRCQGLENEGQLTLRVNEGSNAKK